jgi:protease I
MDKRIAILATDGFEESELQSPKEAIEKQGWKAEIVSLKSGSIKSWSNNNWGKEYAVDNIIDDVRPSEYDGLLIPGGVINPDKLRKGPGFRKGIFRCEKTCCCNLSRATGFD